MNEFTCPQNDLQLAGIHGLEAILDDVGWADEPLPTEIMALLLQSNYDASNYQLRGLMMRYYSGSSSTAFILDLLDFESLTGLGEATYMISKMLLLTALLYFRRKHLHI